MLIPAVDGNATLVQGRFLRCCYCEAHKRQHLVCCGVSVSGLKDLPDGIVSQLRITTEKVGLKAANDGNCICFRKTIPSFSTHRYLRATHLLAESWCHQPHGASQQQNTMRIRSLAIAICIHIANIEFRIYMYTVTNQEPGWRDFCFHVEAAQAPVFVMPGKQKQLTRHYITWNKSNCIVLHCLALCILVLCCVSALIL